MSGMFQPHAHLKFQRLKSQMKPNGGLGDDGSPAAAQPQRSEVETWLEEENLAPAVAEAARGMGLTTVAALAKLTGSSP